MVEKSVEKVVTATPVPPAADAKKIINFWSMWSTQPLNQQFVNTVTADYMKEHPDVQINVSYWEKAALDQALQAALKAGEGAPDIAGDTNSPCLPKQDGCWTSAARCPRMPSSLASWMQSP